MVLTADISKKIKDHIYQKPRTVQEIAFFLNKNWRTANVYIEKISQESGEVAIRTLREGTRGAVKIVYWNNIDKPHFSNAQERLFKQIELGKNKADFSPFDIYQYIKPDKRHSFIEEQEENPNSVKHNLAGVLRRAQKQILIFAGDFTWANLKHENKPFLKIFEELIKKDISIKILAKVDITSMENIKKMQVINTIIGKDRIEIRHCEQPLRGIVVDNKIVKLKEIKNIEDYSKKLRKKSYIFYEIYDKSWIDWMQKVFFNLFRISISAEDRINNLKTIGRIHSL